MQGQNMTSTPERIPAIEAPGAPEHVLEPLREWIDEATRTGSAFQPDEEFQYAFIRFRVEKRGGRLRVLAPTLGRPALLLSEDCSEALRLIARQQALMTRFGLEGSPCNSRQTALVVRDLDSCKSLFIERLAESVDDQSGWYFGAHDTELDVCDPANLANVSIWDVIGKRAEIAPYLLLPPNWQVSFHGEKPIVMRDREPVEPGRRGDAFGLAG
ncbi:MAG: hypothetical protein AAGA20_19355 [Planctomycetota bacterium]